MKITVELPIEEKTLNLKPKKGEVYRRINGNYFLVIDEGSYLDIGSETRGYVAGPFPTTNTSFKEAKKLPSGTKVTFETV